jgi:hypothetical protein
LMKVTILVAVAIILSLFAAGCFIAQILAFRRAINEEQ